MVWLHDFFLEKIVDSENRSCNGNQNSNSHQDDRANSPKIFNPRGFLIPKIPRKKGRKDEDKGNSQGCSRKREDNRYLWNENGEN